MAAQDHLNSTQFFHVAPTDYRESIAKHGLDYSRGEDNYAGRNQHRGNYLFTHEEAAHAYHEVVTAHEQDEYGPEARSYDIYHVTNPGKIRSDPFKHDESGLGKHSVYTTNPIPATNLKRLS